MIRIAVYGTLAPRRADGRQGLLTLRIVYWVYKEILTDGQNLTRQSKYLFFVVFIKVWYEKCKMSIFCGWHLARTGVTFGMIPVVTTTVAAAVNKFFYFCFFFEYRGARTPVRRSWCLWDRRPSAASWTSSESRWTRGVPSTPRTTYVSPRDVRLDIMSWLTPGRYELPPGLDEWHAPSTPKYCVL